VVDVEAGGLIVAFGRLPLSAQRLISLGILRGWRAPRPSGGDPIVLVLVMALRQGHVMIGKGLRATA
jgi:hypothetical protein